MSLPTLAQIETAAQAAADELLERWSGRPKFGIVLGTGAGVLAEHIQRELEVPYNQFALFPASTALGHAGQFVCGQLAGQPVVAMQGRFHMYEGYPRDLSTIGIHTLARMGIQYLFLSNAAGGIHPRFRRGEIMLITSHLDLMFRTTSVLPSGGHIPRPFHRADQSYDLELIQQAESCARLHQFVVHRGTYCGLLGPNYETRAEYRFLRRIGGDTVGMSTIPEVCTATHYGLRTLGLSIVTNVARPDALDPTSGQEVVDAAQIAAPNLQRLFENAIRLNSESPLAAVRGS